MNKSHQPLAVGFHTGANTESVSVRSSSGPSISGSGAISGEMVRARSAMVDLRILVLHARQMDRARSGAELMQHVVGAHIVVRARDFALLVVERAERDRLGRAYLRAGRGELAVGDLAPGDARVDARAFDALHAVG